MDSHAVGVSTWLPITVGGWALILLVARIRAVPLVRAGHINRQDLNRVMLGSFAFIGAASLILALNQSLSAEPDVFCLSRFPPRHTSGVVFWFMQLVLNGAVMWWVWARDGADLLARVAPAFARGSVLKQRYSPATVRFVVSAIAVGAPLSAIVIQQIQPALNAGCSVI